MFGFITDIKRLPKPLLFEFAHASRKKPTFFYIYILLLFNKLSSFIWNLEYSLNVRQINDRKEKYGVLLEYQR